MEINDRKCRLEEAASNPKTIWAGERFKRDAPDFNRVWSGWGLNSTVELETNIDKNKIKRG